MMEVNSFIGKLNNNSDRNPEEDVFTSIWNKYERVIIESLITSFGLDFIIKDQLGGDVDTVNNVRKIEEGGQLKYKNKQNEVEYKNRGDYNSVEYHSDKRYIEINRKISKNKKKVCW